MLTHQPANLQQTTPEKVYGIHFILIESTQLHSLVEVVYLVMVIKPGQQHQVLWIELMLQDLLLIYASN